MLCCSTMLSSEPSVSSCLVAGGGPASTSMAADQSGRWLLMAGWLWRFLKQRQQWSLLHQLSLLFMKDFSKAQNDIGSILHIVELLSKLEQIHSNLATALSTKNHNIPSTLFISTMFTASSPSGTMIAKHLHLRKQTCSVKVCCYTLRQQNQYFRT